METIIALIIGMCIGAVLTGFAIHHVFEDLF